MNIQDFFRRGEPLRNGVTDWLRKQILKANTKPQVISGRGVHPCIFLLEIMQAKPWPPFS